jgi:hypothetical protein
MTDDHPHPRLCTHNQAAWAVALDLLEAYTDDDGDPIADVLEADHDGRNIAHGLAASHAELIRLLHVQDGYPCIHSFIDYERAQLEEEAALDAIEASLGGEHGKDGRHLAVEPRFRELYDIPDDCEVCNGPSRPSDSAALYAHCRAAHPRRDASLELQRLNDAADRGEPADYSELRRWLR